MPDHFLGIHHLAVDDSGNLPVRAAGIKADPAAVGVAADGTGGFVRSGAFAQGQIQNLQRTLVELLEEIKVESTLALRGVCSLKLFGDVAAAADIHFETADGPQQELHIAFHEAIVSGSHFCRAVDFRVADGDEAFVPLNSDGNILGGTLFVFVHPNTKGNEAGIQLGAVLQVKRNTKIIHVILLTCEPLRKPLPQCGSYRPAC